MIYLRKDEILSINHHQIDLFDGFAESADDDVLINFTLSVASGEQSLEQVQAWFQEHITTL